MFDESTDDGLQDLLLDHEESPRNRGPLDDATHAATRRHPLCGDEISVWVRVEDGRAAAVRWEGRGCVLSRASASLLCEAAEGRLVAELSALGEDVTLAPFGLSPSPSKRLCAALAPLALRAALGIHKHFESAERVSPGSSCGAC